MPAAERAADLVEKLTLQEKLTLLSNKQQAVPRLGLKAFDFLTGEGGSSLRESPTAGRQPHDAFRNSRWQWQGHLSTRKRRHAVAACSCVTVPAPCPHRLPAREHKALIKPLHKCTFLHPTPSS